MIYSDIIIIGGGAAGLMAAWSAACSSRHGAKVTILEKMPRPGRKIGLTGKGRCNFTNVKEWNDFSTHIHPKAAPLRPAYFNLPPLKLIELFQKEGLPCVVERGERAFPESHKSLDVVDTLVSMARKEGVSIVCGCPVASVCRTDDGFMLQCGNGAEYGCRKLIVTCGGLSYPTTGSDGDGHSFAKSLGHRLTRLFPSLTALVPKGYKEGDGRGHIHRDTPPAALGRSLMGRSMKNVGVTLYIDGQAVQSEFGDVDFTDGGLEGPMGFKLSRKAVNAIDNGGKVRIEISFGPANTGKDDKIREGKGRTHHNETEGMSLDIVGYVGYERAVVTAGGVCMEEIIPKSMESRIVSGLYFAGEVLDYDADTGGYNLHCAFATGTLAGQNAAAAL